jgi:N-dimethylarginine dimethylaminohydrolase
VRGLTVGAVKGERRPFDIAGGRGLWSAASFEEPERPEGGRYAGHAARRVRISSGDQDVRVGRQVEDVLRAQGVEMLKVDLAGYRQHIDGGLTMIDVDTALINPGVLPFWFLEKLKAIMIRTIEVHHEDEFFTVNCLAVRPGRVIMSETSPRTLERLDKAGIEVIPIAFEAVYRGGGGIHCSTAPLVRDAL